MTALDLILPSFVADSLSLGPHWVYDLKKLDEAYPQGVTELTAPLTSYHPGKEAGDQTHIGDQTLILLESIANRGTYSEEGWLVDWRNFWKTDTKSYHDHATKDTLLNHENGEPGPSKSTELAASSRLAPILAGLAHAPLSERIAAARSQNALTHGDAAVIESAEFFVRAVDAIQRGLALPNALDEAARESSAPALQAGETLALVRDLESLSAREAGAKFGLTCSLKDAFPLTLFLALHHGDSLPKALSTNAECGGDSATRGMILGYLLGAVHGAKALPESWVQSLHLRSKLVELCAQLPR